MLKNLFVAIVGGLVIWFVQDYFRDVPKASFSISNPIEIPDSSGRIEYAQEISIANSGRSTVKDISLRVPFAVSSYKITKHSSLAKEELGGDKQVFELMYPELPVGQRFTVLIRYAGGPIDKKSIKISHSTGGAINQEDDSGGVSYSWLWIAFFSGWFFTSLSEILRIKRESFARWGDSKKIYIDDKPWFFSQNEWPTVQFERIKALLEKHEYSGIERSESFKLLNANKPKLLDANQWLNLINHASEILMAKFSKELTTYSSVEKLVDLSRIKKPELLSSQSWEQIQKSLSDYIYSNLLPNHISEKDLIIILEENSPKLRELPVVIANRVKVAAGEKYFNQICNECRHLIRGHQRAMLEKARFDVLNANQKSDFISIAEKFERMTEFPSNWSYSGIEMLLSKGKPIWMRDDEFSSLSDFVEKSKGLSDECELIRKEKVSLAFSKGEVEKIIKKVTDQLNFINQILINPAVINRIEDYDETFSPGNWINLRKIALTLHGCASVNN